MKSVLFFGDSLTAGYGLRNVAEESFPALIQQKINAAQFNYKVINAGVSGDTTAGGLNRIDYWLAQPVDVFILELGANDILRGIPPQTTAKNLQAIVDKVKAKYPQVKMALMGMELPSIIPVQLVRDFSSIFKTVAEANHMAFVPFFLKGVAGQFHLNLPDRIHPTAEGYKIIAYAVWPVIEALL
ncbi:arylesterase [Mucilaginibacter koreensis]